MDAFEVFFDRSVLEIICKYTNAEGAFDPSFKPIDICDLRAWLAILINAGKNHDSKTHIKELWSSDEVNARLFYAAVMGRDR